MRPIISNKVVHLDPKAQESHERMALADKIHRRANHYEKLSGVPPEIMPGHYYLSDIATDEFDALEQDDGLEIFEKEYRFLGFLSGASQAWLESRQLPLHLTNKLIRSYLFCEMAMNSSTVRYLSRASTLLIMTDTIRSAFDKGHQKMREVLCAEMVRRAFEKGYVENQD
ncbi:MAG: hypothetical protein QGG54_14500 [Gammaproteobacteria bacterium]|nr:hypothetical protein [Gammaproteobacteria bacterium]